jgi:hypothetical protein
VTAIETLPNKEAARLPIRAVVVRRSASSVERRSEKALCMLLASRPLAWRSVRSEF